MENNNAKIKTAPLKAGHRSFSLFAFRFSLQQSETAGFTLLEMIISIGIFSVLVVASIGVTLGVSNAQIKAANIQTTQDNIRFSMELMTKEMRTGYQYAVSAFCPGHASGEEISFTTASGDGRIYYRVGDRLMRVKASGRSAAPSDCDRGQPLMADEVGVERLRFIVSGTAAGGADGQPRVTVAVGIRSKSIKQPLESRMNLQTTVVQRLRDL